MIVHPGSADAQAAQSPAVATLSIQTQKPANAAAVATSAPPEKAWTPPTSLGEWASSITFGGQVKAGIAGNPQDPSNGNNFGQVITGKAKHPILNQMLLTLERDTDPKATGYDASFKLQAL